MGVVFEPDSLWNLALGALGQYICSVSENITVGTCKRLKRQLRRSIPLPLANQVTLKLLQVVNENVLNLRGKHKKLVSVVILPSVTTLDFLGDYGHSREIDEDYWEESILKAVWKRLDTLSNLKVLRLNDEFQEVYSLSLSSSLVEFTCSSCTYQVLKQLSVCCKYLKKLDLSDSESIDGMCIEFILKFEYLEDVNVQWTEITQNYLTRLLKGLARNSRGPLLKRFGCDRLNPKQMEYLIQTFTGMVNLNLCMDFTPLVYKSKFHLLSSLKDLRSLRIDSEDFPCPYLDIILDVLGKQLTQLEVPIVDVFKMAEKCISVECLHVTAKVYTTVESQDVLKKLPGLKSVKCLYVSVRKPEVTACLISLCRKVEVLNLYFYPQGFQTAILNAFTDEPLTELRDLTCNAVLDCNKEIVNQIVECCPSLQILRGAYVWNRFGNEAQKKKNYLFSSE